MSVTLDRMRRDVAAILYMTPEEIGPDDDLMDLGLDSLRLMTLTLGWQEAGLAADFAVFAQGRTLNDWWTALQGQGVGG